MASFTHSAPYKPNSSDIKNVLKAYRQQSPQGHPLRFIVLHEKRAKARGLRRLYFAFQLARFKRSRAENIDEASGEE